MGNQGYGNTFFYPNGIDGLNYNLVNNPFTDGIWQHVAVTMKQFPAGRSKYTLMETLWLSPLRMFRHDGQPLPFWTTGGGEEIQLIRLLRSVAQWMR